MTPKFEAQPKLKPQNESEWEEIILSETLNDAVDEDGNLDFDKLRSTGVTLDIEELYSDKTMTNPH